MSKKKSKGKKKASKKKTEASLDGRTAARALKAALADAKKDEPDDAESRPAPRRRRPPTSHGPVPPRRVPPEPPPEKKPRVPGLSRPAFHRRHDLVVIAVALALLVAGSLLSRSLAQSTPRRFDRLGLRFNRPAVFLPPQDMVRDPANTAADGTRLPYHVVYQSPTDPLVRLEVHVDLQPAYKNLRATRALDHASRYGELVWLRRSGDVKLEGRLWLRSEYRYAFKPNEFAAPAVATAVELATINGTLLYVVTFHGTDETADLLADAVTETLAVDANHPAAAAAKE